METTVSSITTIVVVRTLYSATNLSNHDNFFLIVQNYCYEEFKIWYQDENRYPSLYKIWSYTENGRVSYNEKILEASWHRFFVNKRAQGFRNFRSWNSVSEFITMHKNIRRKLMDIFYWFVRVEYLIGIAKRKLFSSRQVCIPHYAYRWYKSSKKHQFL